MTKKQNKQLADFEQRLTAIEQRVALCEQRLRQAIDSGQLHAGNNGATPPATETELIQ